MPANLQIGLTGRIVTPDVYITFGVSDGGAHLLDVCVALTERTDEAGQQQNVGAVSAVCLEREVNGDA